MVYGRPLMIRPTTARAAALPQIMDDEELINGGQRASDKPTYIEFWIQAVKLIQIIGEIADAFDAPGTAEPKRIVQKNSHVCGGTADLSLTLIQSVKAGHFEEFFQLDSALTQWHDELPTFLRHSTYASDMSGSGADVDVDALSGILATQAKVLQSR